MPRRRRRRLKAPRPCLMVRKRELERAEAALIESSGNGRQHLLHRGAGAGVGPRPAGADRKRTGGAGGNAAGGDRRSGRPGDRRRSLVARCGADQAGRGSGDRRLGRRRRSRPKWRASIPRQSPRFRPSASRNNGCRRCWRSTATPATQAALGHGFRVVARIIAVEGRRPAGRADRRAVPAGCRLGGLCG